MIEKLFDLQVSGTTVRREIVAGCTTFMTLSYIIFVQPTILSVTGMDSGAVMTATCISSALAMILMAFLANYPFALAPAMGHNVYFAFTVCGLTSWEDLGIHGNKHLVPFSSLECYLSCYHLSVYVRRS